MTSYLRQKLSSSPSSSSQQEKGNGTESETKTKEAVNGEDHQDQVYDEELEQSKIKEIRALFLSRQPSFSLQEVDDLRIRRFLRTCDLDIEKAYSMLFKYLNWRKEFVPDGSISPSEIQNDLAQNKSFIQGHDKLGRPIVVSFGGRHKQTSLEEFKRYYTFILDKLCSRMPTGQEQYLAIYDLKGWGFANSDIRGNIAAVSILQDYYPETMGKFLMVNVPSLYMTVWKIISPFFDSKTKKKIMFVENKKLRETLLSYIDESQLPETYGGKLPLVPIQDC